MDYTNSQMTALIEDLIHSSRNREILKRRLIDGIVFEKLSEEFAMSTRQIKNIVYKAEEQLFKHL